MEATPPSPSLFLDLPPTSCSSDHHDNDLVLQYISRMLMQEEDIAEKLFYQQYGLDDDPALLEAQQPFVEIISINAGVPSCSVELSGQPLPDASAAVAPCIGTTESMVDTGSLLPLPAKNSCMDEVSMAFFRGMEEANKFLPSVVDGTSRKKKHEPVEETGGDSRSSKQMAAPLPPESEEEATAREMLDRLMLEGYDPRPAVDKRVFHRVAMAKEEMTMSRRLGKRRSAACTKPAVQVDLHTLLIRCAEAMSTNDWHAAAGLLERIKDHSSPTGDGTQRLALCFANSLEARLAGTGSQIYQSLVAKRASMVGVLKAYQLSMASCCCFLPIQLLFSNETIYKAAAGRKKLHIVDFGLGHGVQWPDMLRWLSRREGGPPEVRLTGIDVPQPGFRPAWRVEETGRRLSACARQFGVPFEFRGIANKLEAIHAGDMDIDPDEVLVVNSMFHLETLMDESIEVERPNPRDVVLSTISEMRPSVFIHGIVNGSHNSAFFMSRFRDALQRFSALFDMMDAIAPRDDDGRLLIEQVNFARCATSIIACEGVERVERSQNYKQWQARNQRAGLRQLPLDPQIVEKLKDKVKKEYNKSFVMSEDQQWLLQGWKGRMLFAISTWTADDP